MAKGEEYNKDFHDAEAILVHYRVDKPSERFYQLQQPYVVAVMNWLPQVLL